MFQDYTKQPVLDYADKHGYEFVIAVDKNNKGGKFYETLPTVNDYMKKYSLTNIHAYELLRDNTEVKLYFDIEWYHNKVSLSFDEVLHSIKKHYQGFFKHELLDEHIMISQSCNEEKESYHVVINNGLYFHNNKEIQYLIAYMIENEDDERIKNHGWDRGVYDKDRVFRMPYQSKYGSERVLTMKNGKVKDHLIRRYSHCEFKGYYEFEKSSDPSWITKRTTTTKTTTSTKTKTTKTTKTTEHSSENITTAILHSHLEDPDTEKVFESEEVDVDDVKSMLECLGNNDYHYSIFFAIACVVKNEKLPFEVFDKWCKKSKKYTPSSPQCQYKPEDTWKKIKTKVGYNKATLRNMLYYKYPNLKKTHTAILLDQITKPTINFEKYGYDIYSYCEKYCKPLTDNNLKDYDDFVLRSHLGTGKSTAICKFIKKMKLKSILCITPRVMFANSIYSDLKNAEPNFKLYKDIPKNERGKYDFMVCQLESLTTLRDHYEMVIFDESESNFMQFHSGTMKENFDLITEAFRTIITKAKIVICADAFISNRTLCIMKLLRPNSRKIYIENTFQPYKRVCNNVGKTDKQMVSFFTKFKEKNPDSRNIIATGSRKNSEGLFSKATDKNKTLLINSFSSDTYARQLQNVNEFWDEYMDIIYTSSITVGISYDSEKLFDNLFLHFSVFGCTVRDMFQASLRARNIKNNVLYYSNYSSYYGEERPYVFDFDKLMEIIDHRTEGKDMELWVKHLWVYNEKELNTNARFHQELIDRYLFMCGYTKNLFDQDIDLAEDSDEDSYTHQYENIESIDFDESENINRKIVMGEADTKDKLEYLKYTFNHEVLYRYKTIDLEIRKSMFQSYIQHKEKILDKQRNIYYEKDENHYIRCSTYHDNIEQKRESIIKIKELLEIENTFDINEISRDKLDVMRKYFNNNVDYIQNTWKLPKNFWFNKLKSEPVKDIHKRTIGTLQTIFSQWSGSDFKKGKRTRKRNEEGQRVEVSNYETAPQKYIEPFVDNIKNAMEDKKKCWLVEFIED